MPMPPIIKLTANEAKIQEDKVEATFNKGGAAQGAILFNLVDLLHMYVGPDGFDGTSIHEQIPELKLHTKTLERDYRLTERSVRVNDDVNVPCLLNIRVMNGCDKEFIEMCVDYLNDDLENDKEKRRAQYEYQLDFVRDFLHPDFMLAVRTNKTRHFPWAKRTARGEDVLTHEDAVIVDDGAPIRGNLQPRGRKIPASNKKMPRVTFQNPIAKTCSGNEYVKDAFLEDDIDDEINLTPPSTPVKASTSGLTAPNAPRRQRVLDDYDDLDDFQISNDNDKRTASHKKLHASLPDKVDKIPDQRQRLSFTQYVNKLRPVINKYREEKGLQVYRELNPEKTLTARDCEREYRRIVTMVNEKVKWRLQLQKKLAKAEEARKKKKEKEDALARKKHAEEYQRQRLASLVHNKAISTLNTIDTEMDEAGRQAAQQNIMASSKGKATSTKTRFPKPTATVTSGSLSHENNDDDSLMTALTPEIMSTVASNDSLSRQDSGASRNTSFLNLSPTSIDRADKSHGSKMASAMFKKPSKTLALAEKMDAILQNQVSMDTIHTKREAAAEKRYNNLVKSMTSLKQKMGELQRENTTLRRQLRFEHINKSASIIKMQNEVLQYFPLNEIGDKVDMLLSNEKVLMILTETIQKKLLSRSDHEPQVSKVIKLALEQVFSAEVRVSMHFSSEGDSQQGKKSGVQKRSWGKYPVPTKFIDFLKKWIFPLMSASTRANQGNKMPWDYYLKKRLNNNRDDYFYAKCAAKANEINTMYEWLKRKRTEKGLLYVKYMDGDLSKMPSLEEEINDYIAGSKVKWTLVQMKTDPPKFPTKTFVSKEGKPLPAKQELAHMLEDLMVPRVNDVEHEKHAQDDSPDDKASKDNAKEVNPSENMNNQESIANNKPTTSQAETSVDEDEDMESGNENDDNLEQNNPLAIYVCEDELMQISSGVVNEVVQSVTKKVINNDDDMEIPLFEDIA